MVLEKSLCFGYGRELQEDKVPIFDAFEGLLQSLRALTGALATCAFNAERLEGALRGGHVCATDLADLLVTEGVPFRDAHHVVGQLVRVAEERGVQLGELDAETLKPIHPVLVTQQAKAALDPRQAVERRSLVGGPARARVEIAITDARGRWAGLAQGD